jgi:hypothetical protein
MTVRSSEKQPGRIRILPRDNTFQTKVGAAIPAEA